MYKCIGLLGTLLLTSTLPVQAQTFNSWVVPNSNPDNYKNYCADVLGQVSMPGGAYTTVIGKNCDALIYGDTQRYVSNQREETLRMGIKSNERIQMKILDTNVKLTIFQMLTGRR